MQMSDAIRSLNKKFDEVIGKQERTLSLISEIQQGGTLILNILYLIQF
jgi:hypothetical protein